MRGPSVLIVAAAVLAAACDSTINRLIGLAGSGNTATHLAFTVQPSNTGASLVIAPAVVVVAQNASGNADTTYTNSVTVTIRANPGGGTLSGTSTVVSSHGVATFRDLQARFEAGKRVGAAARGYVPGGDLIGFRHFEFEPKIAATHAALSGTSPAIYEAALAADGAYAVLDILERGPRGFHLI